MVANESEFIHREYGTGDGSGLKREDAGNCILARRLTNVHGHVVKEVLA